MESEEKISDVTMSLGSGLTSSDVTPVYDTDFRSALLRSISYTFVPRLTSAALDAMSPEELWDAWYSKIRSYLSATRTDFKEIRKTFCKNYYVIIKNKEVKQLFLNRVNTNCLLGSAMKHYILDRPIEEFEAIRQKHIENTYYDINRAIDIAKDMQNRNLVILDGDANRNIKLAVADHIEDAFVIYISQAPKHRHPIVSLLFENMPNRIFLKATGTAEEETDHTISTLLIILHNLLHKDVVFIVISHDKFIFALESIYRLLGRKFNATYVGKMEK